MSKYRNLGLKALTFGAAALALGAFAPVSGQEVDARWLPWMGCWEATGEDAGTDLLCVRPAAQPGGMEFLRVADDAVVAREVVWADGQRHETTREACTGWEQGSFSQDGRRLFLSSEYTCDGGTIQEGGGIIAMASPSAFLDVRVAGMGGERMAWVQHYRAAAGAQAEAAGFGDVLEDRAWSVGQARMIAAAPLDIEDVIEASHSVPAEAVEAFLAERGDRMYLKAAQVIQLADAGVPDRVIDVAVATSYPQSFRLASGGGQAPEPSALDEGSLRRRWGRSAAVGYNHLLPSNLWALRYGYSGSLYYGYGYSPYGYGYNPYTYGYGYGYGYGGYGYGGYRPVVVQVDRSSDRPHGRVVNGRGYTQGRGSSSGGSSQGYVPRSTGASGTSSAGSGSSSSGSSTGRTAKPRGGGNR